MLALRSAKALQEKILLKVQGIRKLPGCGYGDCWTRSQSDNTVGYPHGFSIRISHRVVNFKKVEKVSEMADIEDRFFQVLLMVQQVQNWKHMYASKVNSLEGIWKILYRVDGGDFMRNVTI
ncbi:hypothetical protein Tco_1321424 [Tanacetum coccineum]